MKVNLTLQANRQEHARDQVSQGDKVCAFIGVMMFAVVGSQEGLWEM